MEVTRIKNKGRKIFIISNIYLKNNVLAKELRIYIPQKMLYRIKDLPRSIFKSI